MSNDPVNPAEVPVFTGDLFALDNRVKSISTAGAATAAAAGSVHTSFGGLKSYYHAPEAEQLFATTKPVDDLGTKLSSDACTIAGALGAYSRDARPLVARMHDLKIQAEAFKSKADGDHDWRQDEGKVHENNRRRAEIAEVWTQFQEVERTAYAKIVALVGGKPLRVNDGSDADDMYGYDAKALKESKSLPWGDTVDRDIPWWDLPAQAVEFGKGVFVDGIWGTIKGLGTLVGFDGWDAFKQSWTGLAKLATGLVITAIPVVGEAYWLMPEDKLPSWLRDSRTAMKETGKALVAWDQWKTNPSRAGGAVTFNVLTAMTGGGAAASGAGKAGAAGKVLSVAGKVGKVIDPMTYVFKGVGFGLTKAGDVLTALKGIDNVKIPEIHINSAFALPEGAVKLPGGEIKLPPGTAIPEGAIRTADNTIKLPKGTVELPPGTVKLETGGKTRFLDHDGNVYDAEGNILQHGDQAPKDVAGLSGKDHHPAQATTREPVGVGVRSGDNAIRLGSHPSDPVHALEHTPGGHVPDRVGAGGPSHVENAAGHPTASAHPGSGSHPAGGGGGTHDTPSTGGHAADNPTSSGSGSGAGSHTPSGGGSHTPSSGGGSHTPSGGHGDGTGGHSTGAHGGDGAHSNDAGGLDDAAHPAAEPTPADHDPHSHHGTGQPRGELMPGTAERTLHQMRAMRSGRARFNGAEDYLREMTGGGPEKPYPVPKNDHPYYPVSTPGGRKVDVPVHMPDGRTLAVEVKHYQEWRTITLKDGSTRRVKGEVPLSDKIKEQINKDLALRRADPKFDPRWVFLHAPPSQALRNYLTQARVIFIEYGPAPKK
ncbi:hypothetical protein ACWCXH_23580 [Kitasatospora sp. NPDC001660]